MQLVPASGAASGHASGRVVFTVTLAEMLEKVNNDNMRKFTISNVLENLEICKINYLAYMKMDPGRFPFALI